MTLDVRAAIEQCLSLVPSWTVSFIGPVPLGEDEPLEVTICCIIVTSREAAEESAWERIYELCARSDFTFSYDDWTIAEAYLVNGN